MGGAKLDAALQLLTKKGKRFKPWVMILTFLLTHFASFTQSTGFCKFDEYINSQISSGMNGIFIENELLLENVMENNSQAIMNNTIYSIPVVFHVIHLGESEGVGSNVSESNLNSTLNYLNDHFRNVSNNGTDVEIEFCLAQRDPQGNNSTGINRVNGSSVAGYSTLGINSTNEAAVKGLSIWPSGNCINIWIVHNIASTPGTQILGYATFPGTASNVDGIVMTSDIVGAQSESGVITHEMGHFFNLYHTFHETNATDCLNLGDCHTQGDKICQTRAHTRIVSAPCNESQFTSCDPSYNLPYLVYQNHMNYSQNSCRDEFVPDQALRVRSSLMTLRPGLLNSLCCQPACFSAKANFTTPTFNVNLGSTINFTNISTGATFYEWFVENNTYATKHLEYQFNNPGTFDVCLRASNSNCTNEKCVKIEVRCNEYSMCKPSCHNLVANGDLLINCYSNKAITVNQCENMEVCNWLTKHNTPGFCTQFNGENSIILGEWDESVVTKDVIGLVAGDSYKLCFEYYHTNKENLSFHSTRLNFGFVGDLTCEPFPYQNQILIDKIENSIVDTKGSYISCLPVGTTFHKVSIPFTYYGTVIPHLFFSFNGGGMTSAMHIKNIAIKSKCSEPCIAVPNFNYRLDSCSVTFNGSNTGDIGTFFWDFGDGTSATGQDVSHTYKYSGPKKVCLTIQCDLEASQTICQTIIIPETCDNCEPNVINIPSIQCKGDGSSNSSFLADFDITIPKGYKPCGSSFYAGSSQVAITSPSYNINTSNPLNDIISVSLVITPPAGYNFIANGANGHITLCNDAGEMICYEFNLAGTSCNVCNELNFVTATCDLAASSGEVFVYTGNIPAPPINGTPSIYSETPNLVLGSPNGGNIPFTITTETSGPFNSTTIFKYVVGSNTICYKFNIKVENACPTIEQTCVGSWNKNLNLCTHDGRGNSVYSNPMQFSLPVPIGYNLCNGAVDVLVTVGSMSATGYISGNNLLFNFTLTVPTATSITTAKFFFCNANGEIICQEIVFSLTCDEQGGIRSRIDEDRAKTLVQIIPNPVVDKTTIYFKSDFENIESFKIFNSAYKIIYEEPRIDKNQVELNTSGYSSGIYYINVKSDQGNHFIEKFVIIK